MKKILTIIIGLAASGLALPAMAEPGSLRIGSSTTYNSGRHACGCAIQTKKIFAGYDRHRRPIYRYVSLPAVHRCGVHGTAHRKTHYQKQGISYVRSSHHSQRRNQQRTSNRRNYRTPTCR